MMSMSQQTCTRTHSSAPWCAPFLKHMCLAVTRAYICTFVAKRFIPVSVWVHPAYRCAPSCASGGLRKFCSQTPGGTQATQMMQVQPRFSP